jgi:acetyltransferase-like isoleucine patch superfamily enzyme
VAALAMVALLPRGVKPAIYRRVFGYRIGRRVRIGASVLDAASCDIGDDTTIGHGNVFVSVGRLVIGDHVSIGSLNIVRGGDEVRLGRWCQLLRRNELNSIVDADPTNATDPRLVIGPGAIVTDGHRLDFTDRIELGERVILGGRGSSLWTHNRQATAPIEIGPRTYVGSEVRVAPGATIPGRCIVALGSVVAGRLDGEDNLFGGVPAKRLRALGEEDRPVIERPTRTGMPDIL